MLVTTAYEIGDTSTVGATAIWGFQAQAASLSRADVVGILLNASVPDEEVDRTLELLLWSGFLGVATDNGDLYSHTVQFNVRRLTALAAGGARFVVHPAFRVALTSAEWARLWYPVSGPVSDTTSRQLSFVTKAERLVHNLPRSWIRFSSLIGNPRRPPWRKMSLS